MMLMTPHARIMLARLRSARNSLPEDTSIVTQQRTERLDTRCNPTPRKSIARWLKHWRMQGWTATNVNERLAGSIEVALERRLSGFAGARQLFDRRDWPVFENQQVEVLQKALHLVEAEVKSLIMAAVQDALRARVAAEDNRKDMEAAHE